MLRKSMTFILYRVLERVHNIPSPALVVVCLGRRLKVSLMNQTYYVSRRHLLGTPQRPPGRGLDPLGTRHTAPHRTAARGGGSRRAGRRGVGWDGAAWVGPCGVRLKFDTTWDGFDRGALECLRHRALSIIITCIFPQTRLMPFSRIFLRILLSFVLVFGLRPLSSACGGYSLSAVPMTWPQR